MRRESRHVGDAGGLYCAADTLVQGAEAFGIIEIGTGQLGQAHADLENCADEGCPLVMA